MPGKLRSLFGYLRPWQRRYGLLAGTRLGLQVRRLQYAARPGTLVRLNVPGLAHPVFGRASGSDGKVFAQHFLLAELDEGLPPVANVIMDAGANVGYATLYLIRRFPGARILCVEVDAGNLEVLRRNVSHYPSITVVDGGVWSHAARLAIENPDGEAWAFRVVERADGQIVAYGIDDVMRQHGLTALDLLKLDVEGAEVEVLASADRWIRKVEVVMVETHERFRPGSVDAVSSLATRHGLQQSSAGEYTVLQRTRTPIS